MHLAGALLYFCQEGASPHYNYYLTGYSIAAVVVVRGPAEVHEDCAQVIIHLGGPGSRGSFGARLCVFVAPKPRCNLRLQPRTLLRCAVRLGPRGGGPRPNQNYIQEPVLPRTHQTVPIPAAALRYAAVAQGPHPKHRGKRTGLQQ